MDNSIEHEQLHNALLQVDDLFSRCVLHDIYLVLKNTARAVFDDTDLTGDGIDVGIEKRFLTKEVVSAINTILPGIELEDEGFEYSNEGVPIRVKFIQRPYYFFKNPEQKIYYAEEFQVANPFENYWKSRNLVK